MPKGWSESVNRRKTDNTMAKRKRTKDKQRSIKYTHKTKDRVTRTTLKTVYSYKTLQNSPTWKPYLKTYLKSGTKNTTIKTGMNEPLHL